MDEFFTKINFPYSQVRTGQDEFIKKVYTTIKQNKNIMISAPTGLGKTISGLAPAIAIAKEKNLTVICLTSRQTQANQIIKTIKDINQKAKTNPNLKEKDKEINYVAFIGKRNMCVHPERELYPAQDFNEFCKKMKETGKCKYFKNTKNEDFADQMKTIIDKSSNSFFSVEEFVYLSSSNNFCPYELAGKKAFQADLIICDYNYLFTTGIRENFLGKIGRNIEECILVIDEAHNLPDRIRSAYSYTLSTEMIKNALKEMNDFVKTSEYDSYISNIKSAMEDVYINKVIGEKKDYLLGKKEFLDIFMSKFHKIISFPDIVEKLKDIEMLVKEDRIISHIGRVANFLDKWQNVDEESYLRVLEKHNSKDKTVISIKIKCIDPSEIATETINNTYSTILMSATLSPIEMYKDILGVGNCETLELDSPFAKKNQLTLVINDVTTKFTSRTPQMFKTISDHIQTMLTTVEEKNAIVFFSSYDIMDKIMENINILKLNRKVLKEQRYMTKEQKEEFVEKFKDKGGWNDKAKVLFAVTSGSFAEGLDLPEEMLEMVIVVGLPLGVPDLFTNAVIRHFDKKFGKGQMYGYIYPAMSKIIQAAGRCIRTEDDKGVVVLMDNRFMWPLYAQTFPKHWKLHKSSNPKLEIGNFFD